MPSPRRSALPCHVGGSGPVFPSGEQRRGSSSPTQVPFLEVPIAWPRSVGLHRVGGLPELGKRRAFPSISDPQPVLTWVETSTCPDPEVSAGIPPSLRTGFCTRGSAGIVLGAAFALILANQRKTWMGTARRAAGRGQTLAPLRCGTCVSWGFCSIAATVGRACRLESLPPPPPAPAQGCWGNASGCGRTGATSLPGFHCLQSE